MSPLLALTALFSGTFAFLYGSWTLAAQDLEMRPIALHGLTPAGLPEAEVASRLEAASSRGTGRADGALLLGEVLDRRASAATPVDEALLSRAADLYRRSAAQFPAHALGQFRLAVALLREGREEEARRHIRTAARCAGNHPALLEGIGDSYLAHWKRLRDPSALLDALAFYRAAVEREGGRLENVLRRLEPVLPDPMDLAAAVPETPAARVFLGLRLEERKLDEAALEVLGTLPQPYSGDRREAVLRARARILLRAGRTDEGLDEVEAVLRDAVDADALATQVEGDLASLPPAVRARFLEKHEALGPRTRLASARALRDSGETSAALAVVDRVLAEALERKNAGPLHADTREILVACYHLRRDEWVRKGAPLQAAREAFEAARLDPSPDRWIAVARLFTEADRAKEASEAWDRALRAVPKGDDRAREAIAKEIRERYGPKGGGR